MLTENLNLMQELAMAYRKAKVDLLDAKEGIRIELLRYEEELDRNLSELASLIKNYDEDGLLNFFGDWDYSLTPADTNYQSVIRDASSNDSFQEYDPLKQWERLTKEHVDPPARSGKGAGSSAASVEVKFRLKARIGIAFHVFSAFWVKRVGEVFDQRFTSNSYAKRVRRTHEGQYNEWSTGTFEPYFEGYRKWRDGGIDAARSCVREKRRTVVFNADISNFYRNVHPSFLRGEEFRWLGTGASSRSINEGIHQGKVDIGEGQKNSDTEFIHHVFVTMLERWADTPKPGLDMTATEGGLGKTHFGLPVGFPVSGLVANAAMHFFDLEVEHEVKPIFYGRYVDDVILVLEWHDRLETVDDVWAWIAHRVKGLKKVEPADEEYRWKYSPSFLPDSNLRFSVKKTRVHLLEEGVGEQVLNSLEKIARENSSEWRLLPTGISGVSFSAVNLALAQDEDGFGATSLSNTQSLTMSRAEMAIQFSRLSELWYSCTPSTWQYQREEFIRQFSNHVQAPHTFVIVADYVSRAFRIASLSGDIKSLKILTESLEKVWKLFDKNTAKIYLKGFSLRREGGLSSSILFERFFKPFVYELIEEMLAVPNTSLDSKCKGDLSRGLWEIWGSTDLLDLSENFLNIFPELFARDLATTPFKDILKPHPLREISDLEGAFGKDREGYFGTSPFRFVTRSFLSPKHSAGIGGLLMSAVSSLKNTEGDHLQLSSESLVVSTLLQGIEEMNDCEEQPSWEGTLLGKPNDVRMAECLYHFGRVAGLAFPTRPLRMDEISYFSNRDVSFRVAVALKNHLKVKPHPWTVITRGYNDESLTEILGDPILCYEEPGLENFEKLEERRRDFVNKASIPKIANDTIPGDSGKVRVAVCSIETNDDDNVLSIVGNPNLSTARYEKLARVINEIISTKDKKPHYVVFPELSLPAKWFIRFAHKLASFGISLIAGVEYIHRGNLQVSNEAWYSLIFEKNHLKLPIFGYQIKTSPAVGEAQNLVNVNGSRLVNANDLSLTPVFHKVITHGHFIFAILICSELTDIDFRQRIRGKIDALFIIEWNKDLNTFEPLVDSAALDLHAYVIQANNRLFGDSRIRAPYYDSWKRDVLRVRGGLHNHFLVGEADVNSLRRFQTRVLSVDKTYKPVPAGFHDVMDQQRKMFP